MLGALIILAIFLIFSIIIAVMMEEPILIVIGLGLGLLLILGFWRNYPGILIPFPGS